MGGATSALPSLLARVIETRVYELFSADGRTVAKWSAANFRQFIESPRPEGCKTPIAVVRKLVAGSPIEGQFEDLIRGGVGAPQGNDNAAGMRTGSLELDRCKTNRDNITDCFAPMQAPDTIPFPAIPSEAPPEPPAELSPRRNYKREAPTGTSMSYALRRLRDHRPDLLERVTSGELTTHDAMVEAGFRQRMLTVPADLDELAAYLSAS